MSRVRAAGLSRLLLTSFVPLMLVALAPWGAEGRASGQPEVKSTWRDRDIRIDGNDAEWLDLVHPVQGQKFSVGVVNDAGALYICLVSKDRVTSTQIGQQGLIVWFSRRDDRKHGFGVHFPLEAVRTPMGRVRGPEDEAPEDQSQRPTGQTSLSVLGPGRQDARRVPMDESGGIQARVGVSGDLLVYEIKLPLKAAATGPYALAAEPGGSVRLELMTPEWRGPAPSVRAPIGIGIGVGGGPGRPGTFYRPIDASLLKPLDVATDLRLAVEK